MSKSRLISLISVLLVILFAGLIAITIIVYNEKNSPLSAEQESNNVFNYSINCMLGDTYEVFKNSNKFSDYTYSCDSGLIFVDGVVYMKSIGQHKLTLIDKSKKTYNYVFNVLASNANINVTYDKKIVEDIILFANESINLEISYSGIYDDVDIITSSNLSFENTTLTALNNESGYLEIMLKHNDIIVCNKLIPVSVISKVNQIKASTNNYIFYSESDAEGYLYIDCDNIKLSNLTLLSDDIEFDTKNVTTQNNNFVIPFVCKSFGNLSYAIRYNNISTKYTDTLTYSGSIMCYQYTNTFDFVVNQESVDVINLYLFDKTQKDLANADGYYDCVDYKIFANEYASNDYVIEINSDIVTITNNTIIALKEGECGLIIKANDGSAYSKTINISVAKILPTSVTYIGKTTIVTNSQAKLSQEDFEIMPSYAVEKELFILGQPLQNYELAYGVNDINIECGDIATTITIDVISRFNNIVVATYVASSLTMIELTLYDCNNNKIKASDYTVVVKDVNNNIIQFERREGEQIYFKEILSGEYIICVYNDYDTLTKNIIL